MKFQIFYESNWGFARSTNFRIPISLQPDGIQICYFILRLFDETEFIVWNIKGVRILYNKVKFKHIFGRELRTIATQPWFDRICYK